ncbi:hypothetical protein CDD83_2074 [Cordyceps sp. RAO-2017]|nr:hypothetical protein CDD83_2074 [Cordyceps sp. RAO-2017]
MRHATLRHGTHTRASRHLIVRPCASLRDGETALRTMTLQLAAKGPMSTRCSRTCTRSEPRGVCRVSALPAPPAGPGLASAPPFREPPGGRFASQALAMPRAAPLRPRIVPVGAPAGRSSGHARARKTRAQGRHKRRRAKQAESVEYIQRPAPSCQKLDGKSPIFFLAVGQISQISSRSSPAPSSLPPTGPSCCGRQERRDALPASTAPNRTDDDDKERNIVRPSTTPPALACPRHQAPRAPAAHALMLLRGDELDVWPNRSRPFPRPAPRRQAATRCQTRRTAPRNRIRKAGHHLRLEQLDGPEEREQLWQKRNLLGRPLRRLHLSRPHAVANCLLPAEASLGLRTARDAQLSPSWLAAEAAQQRRLPHAPHPSRRPPFSCMDSAASWTALPPPRFLCAYPSRRLHFSAARGPRPQSRHWSFATSVPPFA